MGINNKKRRAQKKFNKARRRKELQKKKIKKANKSFGPVWQRLPNPFANLSEDVRRKVIQEISQNSEKTYQESLSKIKDILHQYDPITFLSILTSYCLTVSVGDDGIQTQDSASKINQSHIEICQALALQIKPEKLQWKPFGPVVVKELYDSLINLMRDHNWNLTQGQEGEEDTKAVKLLQHWMRSHTQMVRNWGYFSQVKTMSREIYEYFDGLLELNYSFSAIDLIQFFQFLIDEIERTNSNRYTALSTLFKLKDKKKLVSKYHELIGQEPSEADKFVKGIDIESLPFKSLFLMLISHYDLWLHENYEFSPGYLSKKIGFDESRIICILEEFSHEWGDLETYETEHLYLSNPVWLHPLIKITPDKYFCALPQVFFSFILPSLDRLVENFDKTALSDRRADYLEGKIVEIINRRFPESNTVSGIKWKYEGTEYETDLITFIDSHAVIVEAKSGKISDPALRACS